nr:immunoglobulin light chain junction region [Macaca mulatta]MOX80669.1 immunoglobulin light chain junction region [Macaca mulatta]MOX81083.1 immunoglobulin light chain junction region [Macaca mulatta]MOX81336.1 immunoglobulin light chain junction region [Macaca mulatta]MOX82045.1 immunoglobulin light chain junction region [Macaca mulatta]
DYYCQVWHGNSDTSTDHYIF